MRSNFFHSQSPPAFQSSSFAIGGIVAKKALLVSYESKAFADIRSCIKGIVFLGTPHLGGADAVKWAKYLLTLGKTLSLGLGWIRDDHLQRLLPKREELSEIARQSVERLSDLEVYSMYERRRTNGILLVDELSATLRTSNEQRFPIERNHVEICKYSEGEYDALNVILRPIVRLLVEIHGEGSDNSSKLRDQHPSKECCNSLKFSDYLGRRLAVTERHAKTLDWIWDEKEFQAWRTSSSSSFLWLRGKPASGKSTLIKHIQKELKANLKDRVPVATSRKVAVADFFYNSQGGDSHRGHEWMMRSILFQILDAIPDLWDCYRTEYENLLKEGSPSAEWNVESLRRIFTNVAASELKAVIVLLIDAMDESAQDLLRQMLKLFNDLCGMKGELPLIFKVIIASRPVPRIEYHLQGNATVKLEENTKGDIRRYVEDQTTPCRLVVDEEHEKVLANIRVAVIERANGVFLWVKLVVDLLNNLLEDGCSIEDMERTIADVPADLYSFYHYTLQRHFETQRQRGMPEHKDETSALFTWLLTEPSSRTLVRQRRIRRDTVNVRYLSEILSILESQSGASTPRNLQSSMLPRSRHHFQQTRIIITRGAGFLESVNAYGEIRFIHLTAREFLEQSKSSVYLEDLGICNISSEADRWKLLARLFLSLLKMVAQELTVGTFNKQDTGGDDLRKLHYRFQTVLDRLNAPNCRTITGMVYEELSIYFLLYCCEYSQSTGAVTLRTEYELTAKAICFQFKTYLEHPSRFSPKGLICVLSLAFRLTVHLERNMTPHGRLFEANWPAGAFVESPPRKRIIMVLPELIPHSIARSLGHWLATGEPQEAVTDQGIRWSQELEHLNSKDYQREMIAQIDLHRSEDYYSLEGYQELDLTDMVIFFITSTWPTDDVQVLDLVKKKKEALRSG